MIEELCQAKGITVLGSNAENLSAEARYKAKEQGMRWLLLPGSDHGVLPGSREKNYEYQVQSMLVNYTGYEVGCAGELVMRAMLKYLQGGTVLFCQAYNTWRRCKEKYKTGDWKGYRILLGNRSSSASGGMVVFHDYNVRDAYSGLLGFVLGGVLVSVQIRLTP